MIDALVPRRAPHVAWTLLNGCVYAVAPAGSSPFTVAEFSETGASIWMHIDGIADVAVIIGLVADEWGVDEQEVAAGVKSFLRQLADQHLIVCGAPVGGAAAGR